MSLRNSSVDYEDEEDFYMYANIELFWFPKKDIVFGYAIHERSRAAVVCRATFI